MNPINLNDIKSYKPKITVGFPTKDTVFCLFPEHEMDVDLAYRNHRWYLISNAVKDELEQIGIRCPAIYKSKIYHAVDLVGNTLIPVISFPAGYDLYSAVEHYKSDWIQRLNQKELSVIPRPDIKNEPKWKYSDFERVIQEGFESLYISDIDDPILMPR